MMNTNEQQREALTEELKIKPICRFCLSQQAGELSNIYAKDIAVKSLLPLPVEIMAVASIEVFLNDGMPSTVCLKCRLIFDYCYRFKQMCKKAESLLNQVPLLGEWPSPLMKPNIPQEILPQPTNAHKEIKNSDLPSIISVQTVVKSEQSSDATNSNAAAAKTPTTATATTPLNPRKILNSNPAALPEPPIPTRLKQYKNTASSTSNFLTKVENNEEISIDDIQRLVASDVDESEGIQQMQQKKECATITSTTCVTKTKPKVLNKSSIRILNKEADINLEPRLKKPRVSHDQDGNVSIVTEIIDPNEPYETEPDPIKNAAPVKTNVFPCPHCDRTFPLLQLREIHIVNHTRERLFQCDKCDRSFFSKYDLQKHTVIHTGERKYKCSVCDRSFTRPALLHRHEKIHTDIPKFICVYCEKPFISKDDMEKHAERHRKNRPFKCKVCSKAFAFKQGLERHEVVHSSEQPYPCRYCKQSFATPSKLSRHLVAHAGNRPFPCKYCPKQYLLSHHLSRHMRTHKSSVIMYACNECDESFKTCEDLLLHSTVHAAETLTCPLCQQQFEDVESVTSHIKEHASGESYPCEFCDLMFLTQDEQMNHVSNEHAFDLEAYNESDNNTQAQSEAQKPQKGDQEIEETIEKFLYDDGETSELVTKQETFDEIDNNQERGYVGDDQIYDEEEYLRTHEMNSYENAIYEEMLTDITIEQQEPFANKIKTDVECSSTENSLQIEPVHQPVRRNTSRNNNVEKVGQNAAVRKSPRGVVGAETHAINTSKSQRQIKQDGRDNKSSPSSSSSLKQTKITSQFKVKKENESDDKTVGEKPDVVAAETSPTCNTVVKMKLGEKKVRVQKIVVTKAEAAAMAKEGRICIKDGNLILTSKKPK